MAIVTKSIGSAVGRDFATIQAFIDSIPTDVVASGNSYVGELYNDSEFTDATGKFSIAGKTTDSSHFITLRCVAGQSFSTNPNRGNNPLWYNQANGVAIKCITGNITAATITVPYTVVDGLQIYATGDTTNGSVALTANGANIVVKNCLLMAKPGSAISVAGSYINGGATALNTLFINNVGNNGSGVSISNGTLVGCTIAKPASMVAAATTIGVYYNYNTNVVKNCAIFGFTGRDITPNAFSASDYNATDWNQAPGGTSAAHNLLNLVAANQFVSAENDFRLKAGSDLIDKGYNWSATYGSSDILGTTRQTLWDIGAFEMPVAATQLTLTGPSIGKTQQASSNFTIGANGYISTAVTVTLSDGGQGGTFTPATVQLVGSNPSATFTYTPATVGDLSISLTNDGGLANPTALTYTSAVAATHVNLVAPTTVGRAGVLSSNFTVSLDGVVDTPVKIIFNDNGNGGSFNPAFVILDNTTVSSTFKYVGATGGVKVIGTTNDGGLVDMTVSFTEKDPLVAVPTPSTATLVVKSIGTGKDFATVRAFTDYAATFDLSANQQSLLGEVYESQSVSSASSLTAKNPTDTYLLILQPVKGLSVNVTDKGDPLDYGTEGIELSITANWPVGRGVVLQDFRLNFSGSGGLAVGGSGTGATPVIQRNRVKFSGTATGVIYIGMYTGTAIVNDNLVIAEDGSTNQMFSFGNWATFLRNTLVRRGSASGTPVAIGTSQNGQTKNVLGDNVIINGGSNPITNLGLVPSANVFNNYTDTALDTPNAGLTVVLPADKPLVRNTTNDFRPDDTGGLIGKASESAVDTLDIYGSTRGGSPDVGVAQGTVVNLLPKVTLTTQDTTGQTVTVSGTTQYTPTSGTAVLLPDATNPNGAVQQGPTPVTITDGGFSVSWSNVPPGNYQIPQVTLVNSSGYNRVQTGGEVVTIVSVSAVVVAAEAAPAQGNAPQPVLTSNAFDNTTFSLEGAIDTQGDKNCTVDVYLDVVSGPTPLGPFRANIVGKKWSVQLPNLTNNFTVRAVAQANNQTVTVTSSLFRVIKLNGAVALPAP